MSFRFSAAALAALVLGGGALVPVMATADDVSIIGMPSGLQSNGRHTQAHKAGQRDATGTPLVCYNPATVTVTPVGNHWKLTYSGSGKHLADVDVQPQPYSSAACRSNHKLVKSKAPKT